MKKVLFIWGAMILLVHLGVCQVRINEILTSNQTGLTDLDGDYVDWIEIYNAGDQPVNLQNWRLTDDALLTDKWIFPDFTINPGSFVVIFASGKDLFGGELHTNFKLGQEGEFLGLYNQAGEFISGFDTVFPEAPEDHSISWLDGVYVITSESTPGSANTYGDISILPVPEFDNSSGFFDASFLLNLSTEVPGAEIYYTTDASQPTVASTVYSSSILVDSTMVVRAIISKEGVTSNVSTNTYIFLAQVLDQPNNPAGYPEEWGPFSNLEGNCPADYEMDPEIVENDAYKDQMVNSLRSLPTISLVSDIDNFFSHSTDPDTGGIYIYTGATGEAGRGWERPASFELIDAEGNPVVQVNCAVEIHGGESRRVEKSPKHSLRLSFKEAYGPSRLRFPLFGDQATSDFNSIILRAGFNNSFVHWLPGERSKAQYVRDLWMKESHALMGHVAGKGFLAHLFINGLYWGIYNPTERINEDFLESYLGGSSADYDIMKDYVEVAAGTGAYWNDLMSATKVDLSNPANYYFLLGKNADGTDNPELHRLVDEVSLIDYMLINMYAGNTDWDHHNWIAAKNRNNPDEGFRFFCWDSEHTFESRGHDVTGEFNEGSPSSLFQRMMANETFRDLFQQRVRLYFTNGGLLTAEKSLERYKVLVDMVQLAVIAETARWGDYRRDVVQYQSGDQLYTLEDFLNQRDYMVNNYFPERTERFLNQLANRGFLPDFAAPQIEIDGSLITDEVTIAPRDANLIFTGTGGSIYYTTDGSDPKVLGIDSPELIRYTGPLKINQSAHVKVREYNGSEWSASSETKYYLEMDRSQLKISEIHYHPLELGSIMSKDLEFLELKNVGDIPVDLGGYRVSGGIDFNFPIGYQLDSGQFVVLASNAQHFHTRYEFTPDFQFEGNLGNSSDVIRLRDIHDFIVWEQTYYDSASWPQKADGDGNSLVPKEINGSNPELGSYWRSSYYSGGSPGQDDVIKHDTIALQIDKSASFNIYPNPVVDKLYISSVENISQISVFTVDGRLVLKQEVLESGMLDTSHLDSGLYILKFIEQNILRQSKFIKLE